MANVVSDAMYNQLKQLYGGDAGMASKAKAQIETTYDADKYNKLVNQLNTLYGSNKSTTPTNTNNATINRASSGSTAGTVSGNTSGTSNLNSMNSNVAINNSRNAQVGTGSMAQMPQNQTQQPQQQQQTQADKLAKSWEGLSYEQQQQRLNATAGLKDALAKRGITSKTQPETTTTTQPTTQRTAQPQTPKQAEWDYQDNSQARMNQIAENLNGYRQTMPQLFDDMSAFYNFFIKDKGRSQDQIDFLWDYYNRVQKYGKYDNLSPEQLGAGIANGDIPEDYLNTLKSTDPQKYQEVMAAKQNREDTIKNESFLNDAATMAGIEGWESEPSSIQYGKRNQIWMDEDNNGIDDRREHYASDEEKGYQKQIADLNAANLEIDNIVKHAYDDLVKAYPGATKATLMAMAQDRNSDLLREKENNLVELTRLQGYVGYMQAERFEKNQAGADSIAQLQKNLGMYYQYSPQGMAELAQAQYGATNITLDQADSGTETQKQMALQNVLDGYYAKYGDIIQRSEQQVINDVIAYAKKNGIGLAQALQENFIKPLQSKPQFAQMESSLSSNGRDIKNVYVDGEQQSVWYNPITQETKPVGYSYNSATGKYDTVSMNDRGEGDYQQNRPVVKQSMRERADQAGNKENAAKNIAANMEGAYLGLSTCGYYVNDYIYGMTGTQGPFGSEIANKRAACTNTGLKGASVGDAVVFDWNIAGGVSGVMPEYGHVGIITASYDDGSIDVSSSISGKVQTRHIQPGDAWYKNIYGTRKIDYNAKGASFGYGQNPMSEQIASMRASSKLNAEQKKDLTFASQAYGIMYDLASNGGIEHLLRSSDGQKMLANLKNAKFIKNGEDATGGQVMEALRNGITDQKNLQTVNDLIAVIELKLRKTSGAAIAASEWTSNFDMLLPGINEDYDVAKHKYERFENTYLREFFNSAGAGVKGYSYKDLFGPNSVYYSYEGGTPSTNSVGQTSRGTWNFANTNNQQSTGAGTVNNAVITNSPYATLFNTLGI